MKFKDKLNVFLVAIVYLSISYLLCSTHERPTTGYVSRRKIFCSNPLYIYILIALVFIFIFN